MSAFTIGGVKPKNININGEKCKKVTVNGETVWNSSVTLKNLIGGSQMQLLRSWQDHAYYVHNDYGTAISTVSGHRYYVRVYTATSVHPCSCGAGYTNPYGKATATFAGVEISSAVAGQYPTNHAIVKATSNSTAPHLRTERNNSDQGYGAAVFYMVVDLTELEAAKGKTYTADSFYSEIGQFYGSKEISI